jgi:hypothetical protein
MILRFEGAGRLAGCGRLVVGASAPPKTRPGAINSLRNHTLLISYAVTAVSSAGRVSPPRVHNLSFCESTDRRRAHYESLRYPSMTAVRACDALMLFARL